MTRALLLLAVLAASATAQEQSGPRFVWHPPVADYTGPVADAEEARIGQRAGPTCDPATEGARFEVTYTGFPGGAEDSFQDAVDVWACRVRSDQVIQIEATWSPLSPSTLGSAGPVLFRNFDGAPTRDVWYPSALADALAGRDLNDGDTDIEAFFNSDFSAWHTGPGPPPEGRYDLTTVVLHELAHGLGFIGALTVADGVGRIGPETDGPFSYDLHTRSASGSPLINLADGSTELADALVGDVRFDGRAVRQAVGDAVPLFSPARFTPGGSYSHLDEDVFPEGTPDGLMTPFVARQEQVLEPGAAVCAVLADVGWTLAGDCARLVGDVPSMSGGVEIVRRGPNPFSGSTQLEVQSPTVSLLSATVYDALGRQVQTTERRVVGPGSSWRVAVDGTRLAAGVYIVVVRGGPEPMSATVVVAR